MTANGTSRGFDARSDERDPVQHPPEGYIEPLRISEDEENI
jgi:hypothetical protein